MNVDLSTSFAGLALRSPLVVGASPLSDDVAAIERAVAAGAGAVVMHSLFEEQVVAEEMALHEATDGSAWANSEATSYLPDPGAYVLGADAYVEQLHRLKAAVDVPVFASLNGTTAGGWLRYARQLVEAGADGIELNLYRLPFDPDEDAATVEARMVEVVAAVRAQIDVPLAVKLTPFASAPLHLARRLVEAGAGGLVLFNRLYEPDLDVEALEVVPRLHLSSRAELLLRLRWTGAMFERVGASLALSGGVHEPIDVVKAVLAGASAVQLASALLRRGPEYVAVLRDGLRAWMQEHDYPTLASLCGAMSLARCPDPSAYARAQYVRVLQSGTGAWRDGRLS